jgi:N-acetylglutamate synthase-like GNAT family acetyltransferase
MAVLAKPYKIRPARNEDGPAITALIYEILHEYGLPPDPENTDQGLDRVEDFFDLFEVIEAPDEGIIATLGLISRDPRGILRQAQAAPRDEVSPELPEHGRAATAAPAPLLKKDGRRPRPTEGWPANRQGAARREAKKLSCKPDRALAPMRRPAGGIREANCREAKEGRKCELVKMFVHPSQRGKGLGQFLLDRAIEQAKALGFTEMELETASVLKEAIGLYRKAGFVETESGPHAKRCDITMVRTL